MRPSGLCLLPLGAAVCRAVPGREGKSAFLLGVAWYFEPVGRGLWPSCAGLSSPAKLAREFLPGAPSASIQIEVVEAKRQGLAPLDLR